MFYIALIVVSIVAGTTGFVLGVKFAGVRKDEPYFATASSDELQDRQEDAQEALSERTQKRKEQIVHLIRDEAENQQKLEDCSGEGMNGGITRIDVEELLGVSEGAARKYLNMLEDEGKVQQVGKSGDGVRYVGI